MDEAAFSAPQSRRGSQLSSEVDSVASGSLCSRERGGSLSSNFSLGSVGEDVDSSQRLRNGVRKILGKSNKERKGGEFANIREGIIQEGWLVKCGGSVKTWKKRWFMLNATHLFYFKERTDDTPLGGIPLASYTCDYTSKSRKEHSFQLSSTELRTYVMSASSANDMAAWMVAISKTIGACKERNPDNLPPIELFDGDDIRDDVPNYTPPVMDGPTVFHCSHPSLERIDSGRTPSPPSPPATSKVPTLRISFSSPCP